MLYAAIGLVWAHFDVVITEIYPHSTIVFRIQMAGSLGLHRNEITLCIKLRKHRRSGTAT